MREIKFRTWDKNNKTFTPINDIVFEIDGGIRQISTHFMEYGIDEEDFDLEDLVLMQFTGLKDKNGNEIYEGDIIDTNGGRGEVIWNEELATWGVKQMISNHTWIDRLCDWTDEEVIGNVYENPELLKGDAS